MKSAIVVLALLAAAPAWPHHNDTHVAPAPAAALPAAAGGPADPQFWLAFGPFVLLVAIGVARAIIRRHKE